MGKKLRMLLIAVLAVSGLAGCAGEKSAVQSQPVPAAETLVHLDEQVHSGGKTLTIRTDVTVPDLSGMEEITLSFDEAALDTMVQELVHSQYPDLEEGSLDGWREWSVADEKQLYFSFSCQDTGFEAGRCSYLDVLRNLNGQDVAEDEQMRWTPYHMTDHIPDKLTITSAEAAAEFDRFLSQYSCFRYKPWNVVAVNCRNVPDSSGYYQARLQPQFEGFPVYGHGALNVSACMSAEGIFTFQGILVLKEQSRERAEMSMTLEEAVEQFKADFADDPMGNSVTVEEITVGYEAVSGYRGEWTLRPAWFFGYSTDNGTTHTYYGTCGYRMEDGKPCLID